MHRQGRLTEAQQLCQEILTEHPRNFDALHLSGVVAFQAGNPRLAAELIGRAITVDASRALAHSNLGKVLIQLRQLGEAVASFDRAIAISPDDAEAHYNRGLALHGLGRNEAALASYDRAVEIRPGLAEGWNNRSVVLGDLRRLEESLASCNHALHLRPDYAEAHCNRGLALKNLGRLDEALASYDHALAARSNFAEAWSNRGNVLKELGRLDEALSSYDGAIASNPAFAEAWNHRAVALHDLKRLDEAITSYERAVSIAPDRADAHWNLAICRLLSGDFARGWPGFEWRWKTAWLEKARRDFAQPLWLGTPSIEGRTILLHSEQGFGDTLQFCRYAGLVRAKGARVILEVPRALTDVIATLDGVTQVIGRGSALPHFDFHCPLLSLPLAFGTDIDSIPARIPYLHGDSRRAAKWEGTLGERNRPRVGLVWSGSLTHKNDRNRSIPLAKLLTLVSEGMQWVSLQKELREGDAPLLSSRADVLHFGGDLEDFADTAALIEQLDLVISVDTSVAHLAGAMGRRVWVILPFSPDWRWLLDRDDSPWYPTARLFRQPAPGDWDTVVASVREALSGLAGNGGTMAASGA
jgi:tetratricopeptide (TPR) repeat protein